MYKINIALAILVINICSIASVFGAQEPLPKLLTPANAATWSTLTTTEINAVTVKNRFTNLPSGAENSVIRTELESLFRQPSYTFLDDYCKNMPRGLRASGFSSEGNYAWTNVPGGIAERCNQWKDAALDEEKIIIRYADDKLGFGTRNADGIQKTGSIANTVAVAKQRTDEKKAAFLSPSSLVANVNAENKKKLEDWKSKNCTGENVNTNPCQEADRLLASLGTGTAATAARTQAVADAQKKYDEAQKNFTDNRCPETFTPTTAGASESETCKTLRADRDAAKTVLDNAKAAASGGEQTETDKKNEEGCNLHPKTWGLCLTGWLQYLLQSLLIGLIAGPLITICGLLFDTVLSITIVHFSSIVGAVGTGTDSPIYATWVLIRNLFNIIILFQLLKIAIQKILGDLGGKQDSIKKKLIAIILFALLTNFSFFFTKALIDLSNIAALQFYAGLGATQKSDGKTEGSIGVAIIEGLGISTKNILFVTAPAETDVLLGVTTAEGQKATDSNFEGSFIGILILFFLLLLGSFILIQGAAIFMTRTVMLILLIILSPLMFARGIIGFVGTWSDTWWKTLLEQLFVAPLYLAILFITLKVAGGGTDTGLLAKLVDPQTTGFVAGSFGYFGSIITMIIQGGIMAGLFIASVALAKKFGGIAAQKSSAWGAQAYGSTVGGVGGYAARKTVGRLGASITTGKWGEGLQNAKQQGGFKGAFAGTLLNVGTSASNAKFDVRNSGLLKEADKLSGGRLGLKDMGKGADKGFYDEAVADAKKRTGEREVNAKKATEIRGDINETNAEKKAREKANTERLSTYGKVVAYELDSDGNHIMEEVRDANNNVVIDPVTGQPKKQKKVKMKDGKVVYEDSLTTNIITGTRDKVDLLTGAKKQSTINTGVTEDAIKNAKKTAEKKANEEKAERKYLELLGQEYDAAGKKIEGSVKPLMTPEEAKEHWEKEAEKFEEERDELQYQIKEIEKQQVVGTDAANRAKIEYETTKNKLTDAVLANPGLETELSEDGRVGVKWKQMKALESSAKARFEALQRQNNDPTAITAKKEALSIQRKKLVSINTQVARARAAKKDIDVGANKFGILKEKKDEVKLSPTA